MTLRIDRSRRQGIIVFALSGRIRAEEVAELKALFDTDYRTIVLDLQEVRLADRDAVKFLRDCEADGMKLENCPAYVREWMDREQD
jgi:predicted metal-binding protein